MTGKAAQFQTPFERFVIQVNDDRRALDAVELELARRVARALRFALESQDPEALRVAEQLDQAGLFRQGPGLLRAPRLSARSGLVIAEVASELERRLLNGELIVAAQQLPSSLTERAPLKLPELPPLPPPARESGDFSFEVRFVDEIGAAIVGLGVEFAVDGALRSATTNAAGRALLEGAKQSGASVVVPDIKELDAILDPRWEKFRPGSAPQESNSSTIVLGLGAFPRTELKAEVPQRLVIKPPLGILFAELLDSYGRVAHANRPYEISGPMKFEGTTDAEGRLFHADVFPGDYRLRLQSEVDLGSGPEVEVLETQLVVLPASASQPQLRMLGAVPHIALARLRGLFFETNKSFLVPASLAAIGAVREVYQDNDPAELLVVGHTDTTAEPSINDPLSLERGKNTLAYFRDDVDAWLAMYETGVPSERRWGTNEDELMLRALEDFPRRPAQEDPVRWFQRTRRLQVDGVAGPKTRRVLIGEYMRLDHASLAEDFSIEGRAHGCGENFPLDESGSAIDASAPDEQQDQLDRRAELFFFDTEFGVQPPPAGDNSPRGSTQYPSWRERAILAADVKLDGKRELLLVDELGAPLFNEPFEIETGAGGIIVGESNDDGIVAFPPGIGNRVTLRLTALSEQVELQVALR